MTMTVAKAGAPGASRRRFLRICAALAGAAALPIRAAQRHEVRHVQQDILLGAETHIQLYHPDARAAGAVIADCFAEVRRLEAIFSLQQPGSALSRLNRDGVLADPPPELAALLERAVAFGHATQGAFDVTVQPLWQLFAQHFAAQPADSAGPAPGRIAAARARVDYRQIVLARGRIVLGRSGAAVTLNGIAQGYITDCVAALLRRRGFEHVLVDMGEMRALRGHPDGTPWRIAIAHPDRPWEGLVSVPLAEQAIATSGGYGTPFDANGRHHHLFDPRTGESARYHRSVSVLAPDATTADALSTGLSALPTHAALAVLQGFPQASALLVAADGGVTSAGPLADRLAPRGADRAGVRRPQPRARTGDAG